MNKIIILEGTDGIGKTTSIKELKKQNIICKDRSRDIISKYMLFEYDLKYRSQKYYEYLKDNNVLIIFLINNDKEELMQRIYSRDIINEYDLHAYDYNQLYIDTYNYMNENNMLLNKLFLVDVTHLSLKEQVEKIKDVIEKNNV